LEVDVGLVADVECDSPDLTDVITDEALRIGGTD
jgi:hypothetical protein